MAFSCRFRTAFEEKLHCFAQVEETKEKAEKVASKEKASMAML